MNWRALLGLPDGIDVLIRVVFAFAIVGAAVELALIIMEICL